MMSGSTRNLERLVAATAALAVMALPALGQDAAPAEAAAEAAKLDTGDTAWMLTSTVIVLMMTIPGLALFYGGMVRKKNVLATMMQSFAAACLLSVVWVIAGYSIAFGDGGDLNAYWGGLDKLFLSHLTKDGLTGTIPESVFITFQMTFAIITPALIIGAVAERIKFSAILVFSVFWFAFSYLPIWHMAWSEFGLFHRWQVIDFAGGTVVHINAAMAGLVGCLMVGRRKGAFQEPIKPHNLPLTVIGASMLWVGWFGFNAGSQLAADGTAGMAMLVTQISCATAAVTWMLIELFSRGKASALGIATGAVAGLVAITPASGNAGPMGAFLIGAASGVCCYFVAVKLKFALKIDDSLDVFGVHGVGGIVGAVLTGVVASTSMGGSGFKADDITMGQQVWGQFVSVAITVGWSGLVSYLLFLALDKTIGLRTSSDDELRGLDLSDHDEQAYEH